jgi:hypothetical protein
MMFHHESATIKFANSGVTIALKRGCNLLPSHGDRGRQKAIRPGEPRVCPQQAVNKTDDGKRPPGYTAADFSTPALRRSERIAAGQ